MDEAVKVSDVTSAHGTFVRRLVQGLFLRTERSSANGEDIGSTVETILELIRDFCLMAFALHSPTQPPTSTTCASFVQGMKELKAKFYASMSELLRGLHAVNKPTTPLLNRIRAVEFWNRIEVSF